MHPTFASLQQIHLTSQEFAKLISTCPLPNRNLKGILRERVIASSLLSTQLWYGKSVKALAESILSRSETEINSAGNYALGIMEITAHLQSRMATLESQESFKKLRYFNAEEQADDLAIRVSMKYLNSPYAVRTWMYDALNFISHMPGAKENYLEKCKKTLAAGDVPNYGPLIDMHHSPCYRAYHNQRLVKYLSKTQPGDHL